LQLCGQVLVLDLTLVTHNARVFKRISGLRLEDWEIEAPL
jgi:predicted nucleic acid-binding protein